MTTGTPPSIRLYRPGDDLVLLTELIHAAYAQQAAKGLRYWGTHQTVEDTGKRFAAGQGLVAELEGRFVGTITIRPPQPGSRVPLYRDPHTWSFCQYAVAPELKGQGIGRALHEAATQLAIRNGARQMALDTAAPAQGLITMYRAWGYEPSGEVDWRPDTNYVSVIMRKALSGENDMAATESTADREFVHSRLIDAPRERVFRAFAEPAHLARWWGPSGFTNTFDTFEFRPGGRWLFVMHGPDGKDYPNESVFREVVAPGQVVFEHLSQAHHFVMTITFTAQGDKTLVGWRQVFDTAAHKERIAAFVSEANEQNLDRLAAEVRNVS